MIYKVYVGLRTTTGHEEIELELDDNLSEEEIEDICLETAMEYIDWSFEKIDE